MQESQIAARKHPLRFPSSERNDAVVLRDEDLWVGRKQAQPPRSCRRPEHPLEVDLAEAGHAGSGYRPMERDDPGLTGDCMQQGGDVGKADERLGATPDGLVIHPIEEAEGAIATADAPNCIDRRIGQSSIQIGQAFLINSGQIAITLMSILAQDWFVT